MKTTRQQLTDALKTWTDALIEYNTAIDAIDAERLADRAAKRTTHATTQAQWKRAASLSAALKRGPRATVERLLDAGIPADCEDMIAQIDAFDAWKERA